MELLTQLLNALWAQDFETLANPSMIGMLYFVLFTILFLENGLLPAAFYLATVCWYWSAYLLPKAQWVFRKRCYYSPPQPASVAGSAIYKVDGWAIPAQCKTGYLIFLHITISVRIICSISMACLRCWSVALSRLSEHYCRPSQDCLA